MNHSTHINQLEIENTKRVRAIALTPSETGLTVIGGRNNQGKTSVLDAIAWTLGGERFRPDNPARDGANFPPKLKITLSNGCIVERSGKNSALKVTDPSGIKAGQQLLNSFVEELALNLPKFMQSTDKEKADTLLRIIGIGDQITELDRKESELYNQRRYVGQQQQQKEKYAAELPEVPNAPEQEVSASALIQEQQSILLKNADNQRKRAQLAQMKEEQASVQNQIDMLTERLTELRENIEIAKNDSAGLQDQSTAELEENIRNVDQINQAVRTNATKRSAVEEAKKLDTEYRKLTGEIDTIRDQRTEILNHADLPLPGLTVENGKLLYNNQPWGNMSGSDQLRVSTAIIRKLNPQCGFVLMDKLEQMDLNTLQEFGAWLEQEGLQAIATRVSTGGECSIIIEDGMAVNSTPKAEPKKWQKGVF